MTTLLDVTQCASQKTRGCTQIAPELHSQCTARATIAMRLHNCFFVRQERVGGLTNLYFLLQIIPRNQARTNIMLCGCNNYPPPEPLTTMDETICAILKLRYSGKGDKAA